MNGLSALVNPVAAPEYTGETQKIRIGEKPAPKERTKRKYVRKVDKNKNYGKGKKFLMLVSVAKGLGEFTASQLDREIVLSLGKKVDISTVYGSINKMESLHLIEVSSASKPVSWRFK